MKTKTLLLASATLLLNPCSVFGTPVIEKPVVDLGYGLWQATVNTTGQYYNFSNIRYAQPPVDKLRFAAPKAPLSNRSAINDGQDGRICPQGTPSWGKERSLFAKAYLTNASSITPFTRIPAPGTNVTMPTTPSDRRENEDCLFLDVMVPTGVYQNSTLNATGGAPVIVWTFGGGFFSGHKASQGDPAGILLRSIQNPTTFPGVVYVAMNYRLGALGWLAGPTFSASGGISNADLYDQRLALEWIQKHIHLFGGDPKRVTLMGESAGAAMSMHQITAFGEKDRPAPFRQAFLQSPAFSANPYQWQQEKDFQTLLQNANLTSLDELRNASSETVIAANEMSIFNAPYGSSTFGPVVDGIFAPQLPTALLAQGRKASNVRSILLSHNADEGLLFTNPAVQNTTAFNEYLRSILLPDALDETLDYLENNLYPPIFTDKTALGYNDTTSRLSTLVADYFILSHVTSLAKAFGVNKTHVMLFSEGPGLHGEGTAYDFYNNGPTTDVFDGRPVNATVAHTVQDWMLNYGVTGNPNAPGAIPILVYGENRTLALLSNKGLGTNVQESAQKERTDWWEKNLYY